MSKEEKLILEEEKTLPGEEYEQWTRMQKILGEFSTNTNGENKKYRWIKVREIQIQIQMVKGRNTVE